MLDLALFHFVFVGMIMYIINVNLYSYILVTYDVFVCKYTIIPSITLKSIQAIGKRLYLKYEYMYTCMKLSSKLSLSLCCNVHVTMYIIIFLIYRNTVNSNCHKLKTGHNISLIENLMSLPAKRHLTIAAGTYVCL